MPCVFALPCCTACGRNAILPADFIFTSIAFSKSSVLIPLATKTKCDIFGFRAHFAWSGYRLTPALVCYIRRAAESNRAALTRSRPLIRQFPRTNGLRPPRKRERLPRLGLEGFLGSHPDRAFQFWPAIPASNGNSGLDPVSKLHRPLFTLRLPARRWRLAASIAPLDRDERFRPASFRPEQNVEPVQDSFPQIQGHAAVRPISTHLASAR